jgi:hypothetical protein
LLLLGISSWSDEDRSAKYGWHDKNGHLTRGGEVPLRAISQMVTFAAREHYIPREAVAKLAKDLVDILAAATTN